MGYTRADLDAAVEKGKTTIEQAKIDIASFDNRLTRIESALAGFNPRPSSLRGATVRAQQAVFTEILVRLTRTGARTCFRASIGFPIGLRRPDNSLTYRPREHPRKLTIARGSRNRART